MRLERAMKARLCMAGLRKVRLHDKPASGWDCTSKWLVQFASEGEGSARVITRMYVLPDTTERR